MTQTTQFSVPLKAFRANAALAVLPKSVAERTGTTQGRPRCQTTSLAGHLSSYHRANRREDVVWLALALSGLSVLALSLWI